MAGYRQDQAAALQSLYPATKEMAGTWERLARIKAQYDPDNLFRLNQNIAPATAS